MPAEEIRKHATDEENTHGREPLAHGTSGSAHELRHERVVSPGHTDDDDFRSQDRRLPGVATVGQSLTSLSQVGSNITIGEVKATQQKITTQLTTIAAHVPSENGPVMMRLKAANDQLTASLQGLPDSATIGQTATGLQGFQANVANAQSAQTQLATVLKCT